MMWYKNTVDERNYDTATLAVLKIHWRVLYPNKLFQAASCKMGLNIVLLLGCVALVAGRTIRVEKLAMSFIDNSEEDVDATSDIVAAFLSNSDITSRDRYMDVLQGCSKGRCEYCKKEFMNACFIATLGKNSIDLEVTLGGKKVLTTSINVPNPPPICKKKIPGIPMVTNVCIEFKNINIKEASGCISLSFKVKFKKVNIPIGCFKIPTIEDGNQSVDAEVTQNEIESEAHDVIPAGSILFFQPR